ncbi:putative PurR-regulated permease PerM [Clostridium tetanomorphum]|uniref:AI-2E family transporter n=1 Tax=Clostridium tetanomorphum TaxID=1553 RepID=A0A923EDV1_CLOTT|nr:AI-2E family transporter [Clostridium tetanomorphum]KAJ51559.1 permease [Clostridium tetanomorphum DSM 665]MBC2398913.1 AI-2E family transporter [Clostridium tetanomorphum]MBP1865208.1 putative PurR-regulated permease PerM [Clostridium tetanomorphum]NRS84653.1 putative PurR-regulated permease PerM [Clostridium tetanomorphum]NRZ97868.1 putative PurR-regulated permease PerM [Clostridium tetanomorphum]
MFYEKYKKIIYCSISLIIFIIFTVFIKRYFKPFFVIVIFLFLSSPIYDLLSKFEIFSKKVRGLISILFVNMIIFIFLIYIGNWLYSIKDIIIDAILKIVYTLDKLSRNLNLNFSGLNQELEKYYFNILNSDFLRKGAVYTTESIFNYFIGNIVAYFILVDKYVIFNWTKNFISPNGLRFIKEKIKDMEGILKVEILLIFVTTIETIFGLMALNIENYIMLGTLCGILDLLPYLGTIIIFIPLILYKVSIGDFIIAFGLICLYVLLFINRQIMEAKFMSNKLKIHPIFTILSLYVGLKAFGIIGMIFAPLYIIICKSILEM